MFRLEGASDPAELAALAEAVLGWCTRHSGFAAARKLLVELLIAAQEWERDVAEKGREEGKQHGRRQGEATLLLRQLERRFGALPGWASASVLAADTATLEEVLA